MDNKGKKQLRTLLSAARPHSSEGITQRLVQVAESVGAKTIASYVPLENEPDVSEFNRLVATSGNLLLPRITGDELEFAYGDLKAGYFGILEPTGPAASLSNIDLMVVPALAADKKGNRLGKGKGFYDRVLMSFAGASVAVVFETELLDEVPCEPHDHRVTIVVTPLQTLVAD